MQIKKLANLQSFDTTEQKGSYNVKTAPLTLRIRSSSAELEVEVVNIVACVAVDGARVVSSPVVIVGMLMFRPLASDTQHDTSQTRDR